jgi:hypothetical protein
MGLPVTVAGNKPDRLIIYSADNGTQLPLGTLNLVRSDYISATFTFGLAGSTTLSTITMSGSSLTVTLGTPSNASAATTAAAAVNVTWTPVAVPTDIAGNSAATTIYTETDNDNDF